LNKYLYVAIGGFIGSVLRFSIKHTAVFPDKPAIPFNTLIVNISGSFILALVLYFTIETGFINSDIKDGITAGLLGAFTTFSALCRETAEMLSKGLYFNVGFYLLLSVSGGLAAIYTGYILAAKAVAFIGNTGTGKAEE